VNLKLIKPDTITPIGDDKVNFKDPDKIAITDTLLVQVQYAYQPLSVSRPLFAMLPVGSFAEVNRLLAPIRDIVTACQQIPIWRFV
jgi:hypothetical protein